MTRTRLARTLMVGVTLGMTMGLALSGLSALAAENPEPPATEQVTGSEPSTSEPIAVSTTEPVLDGATSTTEPAVEPAPPTTTVSTAEAAPPVEPIEQPAPPNNESQPGDSAPPIEAPETTLVTTETPDISVEATAPETNVEAPPSSIAAEPTEPLPTPQLDEPTYGVDVEAVCIDLTPFVAFISTGTGDIRVSVGPEWMVLTSAEPKWQATWPTLDDGSFDTEAKWDAHTTDTMEPIANGVVRLPPDCPPQPEVPAAPEGLTAIPGDTTVDLQWQSPVSDGGTPILDYITEQSPDGISSWTVVADGEGTATTHTVTGLVNGTLYYFRVLAVNANGTGPASLDVKVTPRAVPSAPRSLTAIPTNVAGQLRLSWMVPSSNGGAAITDYVVERSPNGSTDWLTIADGVNTATSYTVTGLTNGVRYYFRVFAKNAAGNSATSNLANAVPRTVPSVPRTLTAAPTNVSGRIRLSWTQPVSDGGAAITDYVIQRAPNGSTNWLTITDGVNTATSYTVTGLTNGVRYYFRVFAKNAAGNSGSSNLANAVPRAVPTAPRSLTATATGISGQLRLAWYAPSSNGGSAITDYVIQRSPNGTSSWTTVNDGVSTATAYTVTGLVNGTRYYFRILARNAAGQSPTSNVANAVPRSFLTAPRALAATPTNRSGQIRLSWYAPVSNGGSAITDYVIQRSPNGSTNWVTINDGISTVTGYTVSGLSNGVRHYFRVLARTARATSPWSNIASAIPRTVPTAPRSPAATPTDYSGQIRLSWVVPASNGGSAITDYMIQRSPNGSTNWVTISDGVGTATAYTVTGLSNGVRYYFRIFARNAAGTSPASTVVSAIPRTVPGSVEWVAVVASYEGFDLYWGDPISTGGSPITGFVVQAYSSGGFWYTVGVAEPSWRAAFISDPGYGCGTFRIAAMNSVGVGPYLGPVTDCWP